MIVSAWLSQPLNIFLWEATDVWKTIVIPGDNSDMEEQFHDVDVEDFEAVEVVVDEFESFEDVEVVVSIDKSSL